MLRGVVPRFASPERRPPSRHRLTPQRPSLFSPTATRSTSALTGMLANARIFVGLEIVLSSGRAPSLLPAPSAPPAMPPSRSRATSFVLEVTVGTERSPQVADVAARVPQLVL
jgi:hypothetical protein